MTTPASGPEPGQPLSPHIQLPRQRTDSPASLSRVQPAERDSGNAVAAITVLGGLLVVVASFLPWYVIESENLSTSVGALAGVGDWIVTLPLGVAALTIGVVRFVSSPRPLIQRVPIILGWLAGVVAAADLTRISRATAIPDSTHIYPGTGLYLLILGAVVTLVGGLVVTRPATKASDHRCNDNDRRRRLIGH